MDKELIYMLDRFPDHRETILSAYEQNEEFRSLCHDFYTSALAIEGYQHTMIKNLKSRHEYRQVFGDLEKEISEYLKLPTKRKSEK